MGYCKQVAVDGVPALLDILDTAGQEEFSSMQDQWIREGQGFLLIYSIVDEGTLEEVELMREKIIRTKDKDPSQVPIVLCGNKCDLVDNRQVSVEQGKKLAEDWQCPFYETSAKMEINHKECFYTVVRRCREKPKEKSKDENDKKTSFCSIL